jgi:hypothetical protein
MAHKYNVGDKIKLVKGNGNQSWVSPAMDIWDGCMATITKLYTISSNNISYYFIDIDGGRWIWPEDCMTLVGSPMTVPPVQSPGVVTGTWLMSINSVSGIATWSKEQNPGTETIKQTKYGARCIKCSEYNEYVETQESFTCYGCKH